jgi:hypothetical protein
MMIHDKPYIHHMRIPCGNCDCTKTHCAILTEANLVCPCACLCSNELLQISYCVVRVALDTDLENPIQHENKCNWIKKKQAKCPGKKARGVIIPSFQACRCTRPRSYYRHLLNQRLPCLAAPVALPFTSDSRQTEPKSQKKTNIRIEGRRSLDSAEDYFRLCRVPRTEEGVGKSSTLFHKVASVSSGRLGTVVTGTKWLE